MPLVPTNRPKPEQPPSQRDARIPGIGVGATTAVFTAALTGLVGWPVGLAPAIVFGVLVMIERIASTRQRWAEAERAIA